MTYEIVMAENRSSKQATDWSIGANLSDIVNALNDELASTWRPTKFEIELSCEASVSVGYANVTTYVSLTDSDSNANSSSKSTQLISVSYKTTDGTQIRTADVTKYFQLTSPYSVQNTSYSRMSIYFDTSNITNKTFKVNYLKLKITYDRWFRVDSSSIPFDAGAVTGAGTYKEGSTLTVAAAPNEGYRFVKWEDGSTTNPRKIILTAPMTIAAYFEIEQINNILADTSQSLGVLLDLVEAAEVIADTTKVYG